MIDNDNIGIFGLVSFLKEKTLSKTFAEFADTIINISIELFPFVASRYKRQLRPVTLRRSISPFPHLLHRARRRDQTVRTHALKLLFAKIMITPLHERHANVACFFRTVG